MVQATVFGAQSSDDVSLDSLNVQLKQLSGSLVKASSKRPAAGSEVLTAAAKPGADCCPGNFAAFLLHQGAVCFCTYSLGVLYK
jgi:hypothetical protein